MWDPPPRLLPQLSPSLVEGEGWPGLSSGVSSPRPALPAPLAPSHPCSCQASAQNQALKMDGKSEARKGHTRDTPSFSGTRFHQACAYQPDAWAVAFPAGGFLTCPPGPGAIKSPSCTPRQDICPRGGHTMGPWASASTGTALQEARAVQHPPQIQAQGPGEVERADGAGSVVGRIAGWPGNHRRGAQGGGAGSGGVALGPVACGAGSLALL